MSPVTQETTLNIVCDNPDCPGNELNPEDRKGWLFIHAEVYGKAGTQHVFCSSSCVDAATSADPNIFAANE